MLQLNSTFTAGFSAAPAAREPVNMNVLHPAPTDDASSSRTARWKKLGIGVVLAFTLKGIVTASMLAIMLLEFFQ